ncbi:MAG: hypothetical protein KF912_08535 [Phycisphaeraceae bacterium]|nr:hypothetical protein [Phycisphaeraceae bacterium]MBX3367346.1 hypothetical protein [Phycisphaeraceae bacterium]QYK49261.1 MAG: hypothetical protein KF838_05270 [Phycisphaeraceae bacterium]
MASARQHGAEPRDGGRVFLESVHVIAMGLWVGSLGMAGAAAAIIFPTMKTLEPTLGAYPLYTEPHWRLAAGHVAAQLFFVSDIVQLICAPLAGIALVLLVLQRRVPWPSRLIAGRLVVLTLLMALLSYRFFLLAPRMDRELSLYRAAASEGEMAAAETHLIAFNADHPTASRVMTATIVMALTGLSLGAWSAASRNRAAIEPSNG